jgi:hypothetical protein
LRSSKGAVANCGPLPGYELIATASPERRTGVRPRQRPATGGSELDQTGGEQFAIEAAHTRYPSTVATISSIASKLLMPHFLRRLGEAAANAPEAPAGMADAVAADGDGPKFITLAL